VAVRSSVASVTTLASSNFWIVPFSPVVVELPRLLPDAEGLVLKGCGLPTGDANNGAADGPAASEAIVKFLAAAFFAVDLVAVELVAVERLGFDFNSGFLLVFRLDAFVIINSSAIKHSNHTR
jgi:hypothetical protein